jgi:hypothetical protein
LVIAARARAISGLARERIAKLNLPEDEAEAFYVECARTADAIVDRNIDAVRSLAEQLHERGSLDHDEIVALFRAA